VTTLGRIVKIFSIKGQKRQPIYAAAKAGILGFAKALVLEMAPNSDVCREI
jgi:NAD(P)-dependent dehydrogenase (short-subunit alcohol dehydrogenase family)